MPVNVFYECSQCKTLLKPKAGDCCVFCSYGSVVCPKLFASRACIAAMTAKAPAAAGGQAIGLQKTCCDPWCYRLAVPLRAPLFKTHSSTGSRPDR
jgi:hypothetical protein